jgi:hypothetical protein
MDHPATVAWETALIPAQISAADRNFKPHWRQ